MENNEIEKKKKINKKAAMWLSFGGLAVIATAVTVPLVVLSTNNDKVQPPITGRYYSILNDNNRFETLEEAKAYLNTMASKLQVYKFEGNEYLTLNELNNAFLKSDQDFLNLPANISNIQNKTFNYGNSGLTSPAMPSNGTLVSTLSENTSNPFVGYIFGDNVYASLEEAQDAWVAAQTGNKVEAQAAVPGTANVITTNTSYSGKFAINLNDLSDSDVNTIISKLSWVSTAPTIIPASDSLATISFADTGTTAHFVDGINIMQQVSQQVPYRTTPISEAEMSIHKDVAYVPGAPIIKPLSTQVFQTYSSQGYEFSFPTTSADYAKYSTKIFPHYEGFDFVEGTYTNADLATYFDKMIKGINTTSITNNGYDMVYFLVNGSTLGIDVSTVNMPSGWETVDFMQNINDTPTSRNAKAELVKAMAIQEMIIVNNQYTETPTNGTPAEYTLTVAPSDSSAVTYKIIGPADGTELTLSDFTSTISGGKTEETHYNYELNYDNAGTSIIYTVGQTDVKPGLPTANDLAIEITKNYQPAIAEVKFTRADAPAIQTETYVAAGTMPTTGHPVAKDQLTIDAGTFNGYVYNDKFYQTLLEAQVALLQNEHARPNVSISDTSTNQMVIRGITYPNIQAAYDSLIYFVDWIGSPDA